jgi:hypothetical protein
VRIDLGTPPGSSLSEGSVIAASDSAVYVAWSEARNGGLDIHLNRSLDAGTTWLASSVQVDTASGPGTGSSSDPQVAAQGASVHVAWLDDRNDLVGGKADVYFNRSLDGGQTWLPQDVRLDVGCPPGASNSSRLQIAASGAAVYVVWMDPCPNPLSSSFNIYFNRSLDAGATWLPQDVKIDLDALPGRRNSSLFPRIAALGGSVYAVWHTLDPIEFQFVDVYLNRSLDAGTTWLAAAVLINESAPRPAGSTFPELAVSGSSAYVTWVDDRNGEDDIYFALALGFQPYGLGMPGSGGIVPTIGGSGEASIGGTFSIDIANGLGGTQGRLLVGTNGPAAIPVEGGTLLVQPPLLRTPIRLDGPAGVPGAGAASVTFTIPNQLALIGTRLNFQARLVDPGAERALGAPAAGVSFTGGLEAWIL